MEGELLDSFGIKIGELAVSKIYLFKEQSHPGRVIVAYKEHIGDLTELSDADRNAYFSDIAKVSNALQELFHPQKINYGAYGDTGHHLHFHLVPKYTNEYEWGGVFAMNPQEHYLSDSEYNQIIQNISHLLLK